MDATWVIMPILAQPDYTRAAIADCLSQSVPTRLLLINQGVEDSFRDELERIAEAHEDRVLLWSHQPPLPSLAATWNRALDFVWEVGGTEALVVNADVRLHRATIEVLLNCLRGTRALFVSAVGVREGQFDSNFDHLTVSSGQRGGPDFSCFLISHDCHARFRFDEQHIPAYTEDLTFHREVMLAGEGSRIFSVAMPYLHYASGTLKALSLDARAALECQIEGISRAYYRQAWGGPPNEERYAVKGDPSSARDGVTTPELQRLVLARQDDGAVRGDACTATEDSPARDSSGRRLGDDIQLARRGDQ